MADKEEHRETKDDLDWIRCVLIKESYLERNNFDHIISIKQNQLSDTNNTCGSILKKLVIKFRSKSGEEASRHMVLKSKRLETGEHDVTDMLGAFSVETKLYGEVLKNINKLLDTKDMYKPWPEFYGYKDTNLLLQDMTESGFKMKKDRKMDLDHAEVSIQELGKYHAMTLVIVERKLVDPAWFEPYAYARHLPFMIDLNMSAFNGLINSMRLHWGPEWEGVAEKIARLTRNIGDTLDDLWHSTKGNCDVINHGEYWLNNLIFNYDTDGKVKSVKILDFQLSHYNSPCWDLAIFLYGSLMPHLRVQYKKDLLNIYYKEFLSTLKQFDYQGEIPTVAYLEECLDRMWLFCLLASVTAPPWMLASAKEGVHHEDDTAGKELLTSFHMPCYQWQVVRDTMKEEVQYWINKGMI